MSKFVLCGVLRLGTGFSPIVCDTSTGEAIFCDDVNGNCVLSNLTAVNPYENLDFDNCVKYATGAGVDGVIFTQQHCIQLDKFKAKYISFERVGEVDHELDFDVNVEYTGEIDFDVED